MGRLEKGTCSVSPDSGGEEGARQGRGLEGPLSLQPGPTLLTGWCATCRQRVVRTGVRLDVSLLWLVTCGC